MLHVQVRGAPDQNSIRCAGCKSCGAVATSIPTFVACDGSLSRTLKAMICDLGMSTIIGTRVMIVFSGQQYEHCGVSLSTRASHVWFIVRFWKSLRWRRAAGMQFIWYKWAQYFEECPPTYKEIIPGFCTKKASWVQLLEKLRKCLSRGCTCCTPSSIHGIRSMKVLEVLRATSSKASVTTLSWFHLCLAWSGLYCTPWFDWDMLKHSAKWILFTEEACLFYTLAPAKRNNKKLDKGDVARRRLGLWGLFFAGLDRSITGKVVPIKSSSYRKSGYV